MKKILLLAVLAVTLCASGKMYAQQVAKNRNYIQVSASADTMVTPDLINLQIIIRGEGNKTTIEKSEKLMMNALDKLGIDLQSALTVDDMTSNLKTYLLKKDNIVSQKSYRLELKNASEVARVFESLNQIGITDINISKCDISEQMKNQVRRALLTKAAKLAKENAAILAEAVGSRAGKVIYIQNYYNGASPVIRVAYNKAAFSSAPSADESAAPSLEISKTTITVNVDCHFELLD